MKPVLFALFIVALAAGGAGSIYSSVRPARSEMDCSMAWLTRELQLTSVQRTRIQALHVQFCPVICRLGANSAQSAPTAAATCQQATMQLVTAVCAELTPAQRERYCQLVGPCLRSAAARP